MGHQGLEADLVGARQVLVVVEGDEGVDDDGDHDEPEEPQVLLSLPEEVRREEVDETDVERGPDLGQRSIRVAAVSEPVHQAEEEEPAEDQHGHEKSAAVDASPDRCSSAAAPVRAGAPPCTPRAD